MKYNTLIFNNNLHDNNPSNTHLNSESYITSHRQDDFKTTSQQYYPKLLQTQESPYNKNSECQLGSKNYESNLFPTEKDIIAIAMKELSKIAEFSMCNQLNMVTLLLDLTKYIDSTRLLIPLSTQPKLKEKNKSSCSNVTNRLLQSIPIDTWTPDFVSIKDQLESMQKELNLKLKSRLCDLQLKDIATKQSYKLQSNQNPLDSKSQSGSAKASMLNGKRFSMPIVVTTNVSALGGRAESIDRKENLANLTFHNQEIDRGKLRQSTDQIFRFHIPKSLSKEQVKEIKTATSTCNRSSNLNSYRDVTPTANIIHQNVTYKAGLNDEMLNNNKLAGNQPHFNESCLSVGHHKNEISKDFKKQIIQKSMNLDDLLSSKCHNNSNQTPSLLIENINDKTMKNKIKPEKKNYVVESPENFKKNLNLRPYLHSLSKKNLVEESMIENDSTINNIASASASDDSEIIIKTTELDDQKFILTSKPQNNIIKEKNFIKNLFKENFYDADIGCPKGIYMLYIGFENIVYKSLLYPHFLETSYKYLYFHKGKDPPICEGNLINL